MDPRLENLTETKLRGDVVPLGTKAGGLTREMAKKTGLKEGMAIYDKLYQEYVTLHDYLGRGENNVMKRLKAIR